MQCAVVCDVACWTWEKKTPTTQGMLPASLFISFPGLFEITISSMISNALFLNVCGNSVRKWVLCDFLHFGISSCTENGTK